MSLAPYVRAMGRGPARARSLTREEAADAMAQMLNGTAEPEAVGALLMLMRFRGETPGEIAGFVDALRERCEPWRTLTPALDWPTYAAGRSRGLPWFLLSAKLIAATGHPVLLHGWNSHQNPLADIRTATQRLGIRTVCDVESAKDALDNQNIAYLPLEQLDEDALRILKLRDVLGLRSAINTALRMVNPGGAAASVQGVFHPPYRFLQQKAATELGETTQLVIKGGGGEFERHPGKRVAVHGLANSEKFETQAEPIIDHIGRLADLTDSADHLSALWQGEWHHPVAEAVVIATTGLALMALGQAHTCADADQKAAALWADRLRKKAA